MQPIHLPDYTYALPEDRIARFPLSPRDHAKLLVCRKGEISHRRFDQLSEFIPAGTLLVFNNTRVIPARLYFRKPTVNGVAGALIEVFLLEPQRPGRVLGEAMAATSPCSWHCLIGNKKRWPKDEPLTATLSVGGRDVPLTAEVVDAQADWVQFTWPDQTLSFADILHHFGEMPLPPYLKRKATPADQQQYQTVYARNEGAVAAPTAGLHFTERVLQSLSEKGVATDFLTLHVGAGTFQPIKHPDVWQHPMHAEQLVFTAGNLVNLLDKPRVFAVGTTSLRSLESLYWWGVKLNRQPIRSEKGSDARFYVEKWYPYQFDGQALPSAREAIGTVLDWMQQKGMTELIGETEILIAPGYQFRICQGLLTNFHLPGTTLMLLVAAFLGDDWRRVYQEALTNNYRFLSFGDSSLLIP